MRLLTIPRPSSSILESVLHWAVVEAERKAYVFLNDRGEERSAFTFAEVDQLARRMAGHLLSFLSPGDRAALCCPTGPEFVIAWFGCLYAGVIAVPMAVPRSARGARVAVAIVRDSGARVVLSVAATQDALVSALTTDPDLASVGVVAVRIDTLPASPVSLPLPAADAIAFLQYTSGSTSLPKGVMVSHGNIVANEEMVRQAFGHDHESHFVGWAPLFHDQGLIGNLLQPLYLGTTCTLLSATAFVKRPLLWLKAISAYRAHTSGGPNFAFEMCVRQLPAGKDLDLDLDLSCWKVAFNGAEPIRPETLSRFAEAFAPFGFRKAALYPCYGLAEGTLFVTGLNKGDGVVLREFSKKALEAGRAEPPRKAGDGRPLVSCGWAHAGASVVVVDPATGSVCRSDEVGEIWVSGPSVAKGYWNRPKESLETFGARLQGSGTEETFLRTGDLGVLSEEGLFVTGRTKDVIILFGRNHYPHDIEQTVVRCHPWLREGGGAAFSVEDEGPERLVLVHEVDREADDTFDVDRVTALIRRAIQDEHDLPVSTTLLVRAGSIPKTTSGKVQRGLARNMFLSGEFKPWAASASTRSAVSAQ